MSYLDNTDRLLHFNSFSLEVVSSIIGEGQKPMPDEISTSVYKHAVNLPCDDFMATLYTLIER